MNEFRLKYMSEVKTVKNPDMLSLLDDYKDFWCLRYVFRNVSAMETIKIDRKHLDGERENLPRRAMGILDLLAARDVVLTPAGFILSPQKKEALIGHVFNEDDVFYGNMERLKHLSGVFGGVDFDPPAHIKVSDSNQTEVVHDGPVFLGYSPRDRAYSHFIYDVVSMLFAYHRLKSKVPELKLAVRSDLAGWAHDILHSYGVRPEDVLLTDMTRPNRFERLYTLRGAGVNNAWVAPEAMKFLMSIRSDDTPWEATERAAGRRIIISRNGSRGSIRRLINQDTLWSIAETEFGFEQVLVEKMSFSEKATLFRDCEHILGEYGGGLQTHFLARPGTRILCLMSEMFERDLLDRTRNILGLEVASLVGPAVPALQGETNNSNFFIDPNLFRATLAAQIGIAPPSNI